MIEILGALGSLLLVTSSFPQAIHTWKTRSVEGLSLHTLLLWFAGVVCMGVYVACTSQQVPLLINYGLNTIVVGINLYFYAKAVR